MNKAETTKCLYNLILFALKINPLCFRGMTIPYIINLLCERLDIDDTRIDKVALRHMLSNYIDTLDTIGQDTMIYN